VYEPGDVVILPPDFGNKKKGVLVRKEPNEIWLVQIGTSGYEFIAENVLKPMTRVTSCWQCGTQLNPRTSVCFVCPENSYKCPVCGACDCNKSED
jgi:hypothetical protein